MPDIRPGGAIRFTNAGGKLTVYPGVTPEEFGAKGDGVTNDWPAILAAIDAVDALGGGDVLFRAAPYAISTQGSVGNGSNSQQSTKHHRVRLRGAGYGTGPEVSNTEAAGVTRLIYTGSANSSAGVLSFEGPLHSVGVENMVLDANGLAGFGVNFNHITQGTFQRVVVRNYTAAGWRGTSRNGFPTGCAYGNADNRFYDCYAFNPTNFAAHGISLSSGVSTATSLAGMPDSARNLFFGGSYIYGGNTGSHGVYLAGADNNQFQGVMFLPKGGNAGGGFDAYFDAWPATPVFPQENTFINCGMTRGVSGGGGGTGSNFFLPYQTGDGAAIPALDGMQTLTQDGRRYVNGVRAYGGRQIGYFATQTPQSRSAATYADMTGYTLTVATKAATKLLIRYSVMAAKATTGTGNVIVNINGSDYGESYRPAGATGFYQTLAADLVVDVGAGSQTIKLRSASSDTNAFTVDRGTLTVQELY
jgi:hypothetical protein